MKISDRVLSDEAKHNTCEHSSASNACHRVSQASGFSPDTGTWMHSLPGGVGGVTLLGRDVVLGRVLFRQACSCVRCVVGDDGGFVSALCVGVGELCHGSFQCKRPCYVF